MTDFFNLDTSFFEKSFPALDGRSKDNHLDASEVLAAALEQMDDIIAATNEPNKERLEHHGLASIPANSLGDKPYAQASISLQVQDPNFTLESKGTVNKVLDHLKDFILSKSDANDNFVPNRDFNISAAKVVYSWLQKQFKELSIELFRAFLKPSTKNRYRCVTLKHIRFMDISRALDNGNMCNCWSAERVDSSLHKLSSQPLHCCLVNANPERRDCCQVTDMSESLYSPVRCFSNDGSDFSDTSLSIACSSSTAPAPYDEINSFPNSTCHGCSDLFINSPRRRRRKVVTRSLVLDHVFDQSPQYNINGLSDSGLMPRYGRNQRPGDDSSSSDCGNITPIKVVRRKPKPHRRGMPPAYYPIDSRPVVPSGHIPYTWVPVHSEDIDSLQKVQELESDKKNLLLQASVLADQVDAQADKIIELERLLQQKKDDLLRLEQNLHQEIISRSTVENNKLELMTELTNLRLRLTAAERDRKESDDKCRKLENELATLQARLFEKDTEYIALRDKLSWNESRVLSNESSEIEKLKSALDSVLVATDKDQKLEDLQSSLTKYKKLHDMILSSHNHLRKTASSGSDSHIFNHESVLCSANNDALKKTSSESNSIKSSYAPQSLSSISTISSCFEQVTQPVSNSAVKVSSHANLNPAFYKSNSVENICPSSVTAFPVKSQYGTMPRQTGSQVLQQLKTRLQDHEVDQKKTHTLPSSNKVEMSAHDSSIITSNKMKSASNGPSNKSTGVSFGKGIFKFRFGKRSSSEPRLASECITIPVAKSVEHSPDGNSISSQPSFFIKSDKDKNKGLLKFFSKRDFIGKRWKRPNVEGDFKRGGIRATAGPRLGWSHDIRIDPDIPFVRWNADMIVDWLHKLGLSMYISDFKRWMCNGENLSKASSQDLEKDLNMKHPLHRKKLLLAVKSMNSSSSKLPSSINSIDCEWVFRWLDDVGLPQYKDAFTEALVDGRMLHNLTVDDLLYLKVTSQLHHVSIKCGIQVLREKGFEPHCLVRRSLPDESKVYTPEMVALWTNHRVMEWLRTVDLSEYAPNLRGSGVHGALIVYESKFNTNLFATLLNIPPTKTLLRRHLATHFRHIVGDDLMQIKREKETEIPLSPSVKIKVLKKNQFVLKKKRNKSDFDNEEYVCPMDIPICRDEANHQVIKVSDGEKLVVRRNSDPSPQERHIDLKDETVERIGAVSKEISSLTTILQGENISNSPSTIV